MADGTYLPLPETEASFHSDKYYIVENRGVAHDFQGDKIPDAEVKLVEPCPACGRRHIYAVAELSCPLSPPEQTE